MNVLKITSSSLVLLFILSNLSNAQSNNEINIVNHFKQSLTFVVGINPQVLPDLPDHFNLADGAQIKSRVLNMQKEAYIRAQDDENHSAFWGVEIVNGKTTFHGYIGKGIAYSWKDEVIVFCTPEEYQKNKSCLGPRL